ncbi:hypothetical protein DXG01_015937 [Tephrocybe rancida]|nr:hypothetical protein DXG01_015937 [Tephrocybe rancida]
MTQKQLNDQVNIHRKFFNDEILQRVKQKEISLKAQRLSAVLAAVSRNYDKIMILRSLVEPAAPVSASDQMMDIDDTEAWTADDAGDEEPEEEEEGEEED